MHCPTNTRRKGATLIEFAIVLLLFLSIIFGAFEIDRVLLVHTTLSNASRAGVRYAIVHGKGRASLGGIHGQSSSTNHTNVDSLVRNIATIGLLDSSSPGFDVIVTYYGGSGDPTACTPPDLNNPGCRVRVKTSYVYDPFTSFFSLGITLGSTSQGVITF